VSAHTSPEDVAAYGAASRLATLVSIPLVIANQVLAPLIGDLHARGQPARLERLVRGVAAAAALPAVVAATAFVALGGPLLELAYGSFYGRGWPFLALLGLGQVAGVLTGSCGLALVLTDHERSFMTIMAAGAVVVLIATPLAARTHGAVAVAAVMCAVLVAQQLCVLVVARRLTGLWTHISVRHLMSGVNLLRAQLRARNQTTNS
jgi:O-antigen/teichoic acid export membrane protein